MLLIMTVSHLQSSGVAGSYFLWHSFHRHRGPVWKCLEQGSGFNMGHYCRSRVFLHASRRANSLLSPRVFREAYQRSNPMILQRCCPAISLVLLKASFLEKQISCPESRDQSLVSINQGLVITRLIIINVPKITN